MGLTQILCGQRSVNFHNLQEFTVSTPNPRFIQRWLIGARYFAYFWHKFLGKFHEQSPWPLSRSVAQDLVQMVFAIHTDMLEDSTAEFLKSHRQGRFVPVSRLHSYNLAPAHCLSESGSETIAYLIKICPGVSVLDLNISQVQSSALWQQKENGILQQLVQKSQVYER